MVKLRKINRHREGALHAFREKRPENIQTLLLHADTIRDGHYYPNPVHAILIDLSETSADKVADIKLALAKFPEEDRKELLNKTLNNAIWGQAGGEAFYALLLQAGADANAGIDGYAGIILARAVFRNHSLSVIKLLVDNGASFKDALTTMYSCGFSSEAKDLAQALSGRTGRQACRGRRAVHGGRGSPGHGNDHATGCWNRWTN